MLISCNNYKLQNNQEENENKFPNYEYNQEKAQSWYGNSQSAISESGYYYIIDNILYFYNINSDINMPLCSRVNCSHSDDKCDAYVCNVRTETGSFECNCLGNKILFYDNHLYCIEVTKDRDYDLYQYDSSFEDRKKLLNLASVKNEQLSVSDPQACMISDGYLYYYTTYLDPEYANNGFIAKFQCNRIKLGENEVREVLGEFVFPGDYAMKAGESNGMSIYLSEDNIYFYAGGTARWYAADNRVQYRVAKYNPATGQYNMMWTYSGNDNSDVFGKDTGNVNYMSGGEFVKMDSEGNFYILTATEKNNDRIVKVNFDSNSSEVIYSTQQDKIYSLQSDGKYLYFFESTLGRNTESYFVSTDYDGSVTSRYEILYDDKYLSYMESKYKMNPESDMAMPDATNIIIYGVDERFILLGCKESGNVFKGLTSSDIFKSSKDLDTTSGVGVINTQDYLDGNGVNIKQIFQYEQ